VPGRVDPIPRLRGRVPSLDGLRGIFGLAVVLIHAMNTPGAPDLGIRHWIGFKGYCFPWNIGLALAVSWCMYHLVDRPSQRLQRLAPRQRSGERR
jgi:peptidoglycan/LPS O-acetylase OafA/YrhL